MKLLFFSTAALMTIAYASKAAVQQAANSLTAASVDSCNWIQESAPSCAPSDVPEIVNVYNYYEENGSCKPEACEVSSIPSNSVVTGVSTITVDGVTETVPVDTFVTTQTVTETTTVNGHVETITTVISNTETVTLTPVTETITYQETVTPSWTSVPVVETVTTTVTVTPTVTFQTTTVDGVTITSTETVTPAVTIETETITTDVHGHEETITT
jgi:hypothetical protein